MTVEDDDPGLGLARWFGRETTKEPLIPVVLYEQFVSAALDAAVRPTVPELALAAVRAAILAVLPARRRVLCSVCRDVKSQAGR